MSSLNDKAEAIKILPVKRGPKRRHGWPKRRQNTVPHITSNHQLSCGENEKIIGGALFEIQNFEF